MIIGSMKTTELFITTIPYETPEIQVLPKELTYVLCVSDGENEDTGEENW